MHMVFPIPSSKDYVAKSWRNTVKHLSLSHQKRRRGKRKNGAVKSDNLSLQLSFAPQQAKVAELFVRMLLSKRLYLRKNIVCRLAIGRSLAKKGSPESVLPKDSARYKFNRLSDQMQNANQEMQNYFS